MASSCKFTSRYPVAYFLCELTLTGEVLKTILDLDKVPKLRTAQIKGFRRVVGDGGANVVAYDGSNFGELRDEETVFGVVFLALNSADEERLIRYTGHTGDLRATEIRVGCSSLLGKAGKMKTIVGRVFMEDDEDDTRLHMRRASVPESSFGGSTAVDKLSQAGEIAGDEDWEEEEEEVDKAGWQEGDFYEEAQDVGGREEGGHDRDSSATSMAGGKSSRHPSLSVSFLHKNEVRQEFFDVGDASDTAVFQSSAEHEVKTQGPDGVSEQIEDADKAVQTQQIDPHANVLANTEDFEKGHDTKDIDLGTNKKPTQSIMCAVTHDEATIGKSWAPAIPWRKELATSPVRPTISPPQAPSPANIKFRKTGSGIRNIVDMFEGLFSKSTQEKSS